MLELIVFFTSFKYIFVEGGEQVLVGIGTTIPLILYGVGVSTPEFMHWLIPQLT